MMPMTINYLLTLIRRRYLLLLLLIFLLVIVACVCWFQLHTISGYAMSPLSVVFPGH